MPEEITVNPEHLRLIPIEYEKDFRDDPRIAWQSFGDVGMQSDYPYFENLKAIHDAVYPRENPFWADQMAFIEEFSCEDKYLRFMHVDLAVSGDACGIAMCHIPDWVPVTVVTFDEHNHKRVDREFQPLIKYDFIGRIVAPSGGEIIFSQIREIIYDLTDRGFDIQLITYDRFQSVDSVQLLRQRGYIVGHLSMDRCSNYPVVDLTKEHNYRKEPTGGDKFAVLSPWKTYKTAMNQGRVNLPYYWPLTDQEVEEQGLVMVRGHDDYGNNGPSQIITWIEKETIQATFDEKKLKVLEPPKGSIDLLEAVVGAGFNAVNNVDFTPVETELDIKRRKSQEKLEGLEGTIWDEEDTKSIKLTGEDSEQTFIDDSSFD